LLFKSDPRRFQMAAGAKFDIELGANDLKDLVNEYKKVGMQMLSYIVS